ncbi:MAG: SGNH/GDSL hydrolase family protein [Gemmatimonadales bacterium]
MSRIRRLSAAALGLLVGATACSDDELFHPANLTLADQRFERYVAMGNSITAGFQSGGINDSTQLQSYAVLLSRQMGTPFFTPLMNRPGCPPPYTNIFTNTRVGGGTGTTCLLRRAQTPPSPYISNVAVPGAEVIDAIANLGPGTNANALTTFFLGGLTQTQMMRRVDPTFVTVWIGNNDVLGAALASDTALLTPTATFQANYTALLDSVTSTGASAVLVKVGVGDTSLIPYFSRGTTYFAIKNGLALPDTFPTAFTVLPNCAPPRGDSVLVGFPVGAALIGAAAAGTPTTLDCADTTQAIQPAEYGRLRGASAGYNAVIDAQAAARTWPTLDLNAAFDSVRAAGGVRAFPRLGQACSANPFGTAFSCDGVHPSMSSHKLVANKLIETINAAYGTTMARIP